MDLGLKLNPSLHAEACDALFDEFDVDRSGEIAYPEYVRHTLRTALTRTYSRVIDLFQKWDTDGSGTVDKRELRRAIKECGFDAPHGEVDALFREADSDASGRIDYRELHTLLRRGASGTTSTNRSANRSTNRSATANQGASTPLPAKWKGLPGAGGSGKKWAA
mmetsp:Transcript_50774/g.101044  ORF Transcript_50774/g.101044 Transcript_50774/m.101044 type:complete len:164 (-) Transcript_50774:114-605(-)